MRLQIKDLRKNNLTFSHHSFRQSLPDPQSQNPRKSGAITAVLLIRIRQTLPKSLSEKHQVVFDRALSIWKVNILKWNPYLLLVHSLLYLCLVGLYEIMHGFVG